jgi:hypothetical protein
MSRTARVAPGGLVYHVLNRSVGRMHMFRKEADSGRLSASWLRRTSGNPCGFCHDEHLHSLLRYVERTPLSAGLVDRGAVL